MLFVLPAWLGFEFLQQFYAKAENWQLSDGEKLTHAAGIVFCKAKTPIRIIRSIAENLANRVKDKCGRAQSAWDYMVLESVDYPTNTDLDSYFSKRYDQHLPIAHHRRAGHLISNASWSQTKAQLERLLTLTTAHQLFRLVEAIQTQGSAGMHPWQDVSQYGDEQKLTVLSAQEEQEQRLLAVMPKEQERSEFIQLSQAVATALFSLNIQSCASDRAWFWLHLLELWNYMCPKTKQEESV